MTSALSHRDNVRDAVTAAAAATATALAVPVVLDTPLSDAAAADLLPPGGPGRAVSVNLRGAAVGAMVVVLADDLAAAMTDGPLGPQDLVDALGPALADAGAALQGYCGALLQVEAAHEVQAGIALSGAGAADGRLAAAVQLRTDGRHVATVALLIDPAEAAAVPRPRAAADAPAHDFRPLDGGASGPAASRPLDLLHDVEMGVTAELGRTRMTVRDLLSLAPGSVVELDRAAGSPVDVLVNGTLIARGEVVVIDEEFAIRISEIVGAPTASSPRR